MKRLFIILWLLAASCASSKHTERSVITHTQDSSTQHGTDTMLHIRYVYATRYVHDTLIKTVYQYIHDTLHSYDLQPVTNAAGKKVPVTKHYDRGTLHADLTILPTGDLVVNMWADSTQTLVHGLIETNSNTIDSNSHSHADTTQHSHSSSSVEKSYTKIIQSFIASYWWVLVVIAIGLVLIFIIKSYLPKLPKLPKL